MGYTFHFEGAMGKEFSITFDSKEVWLDGYHRGSLSGGSGTEYNYAIVGPKVAVFYSQIGVKTAKGLANKIPAYATKDWEELESLVFELSTETFTWGETDWS